MKKQIKIIGVAVICLVSFLALLNGLIGMSTRAVHAQAEPAATAANIFLPIVGCSTGCSGTNGTPTPTPSPTATPTPSVLHPALIARYGVKVSQGITYGQAQVTLSNTVTNTNLLLDLYEPVGAPAAKRPVVLIVHGGAFLRGTRQEANLVKAANEFAARGYVVASMDYRLGGGDSFATTGKLGAQPVVSARVAPYQQLVNKAASIHFLDYITDTNTVKAVDPIARLGQAATMEDTLLAIDWLGSQANSRSLDLSRLVMMGGSAGAIESIHAAYALDDLSIPAPHIAAVLDYWGAFNLADSNVITDGVAFMETGESPIFIAHGTNDREVPFAFGQAIFNRANAVGIPVEFNPIQGGIHGFPANNIFTTQTSNGQTIFQRSVEFLNTQLFKQELVVMAQ